MDIGTLAEAIPLQEFVQLTKTTTAGKARLLHDAQLILGPASKVSFLLLLEKIFHILLIPILYLIASQERVGPNVREDGC